MDGARPSGHDSTEEPGGTAAVDEVATALGQLLGTAHLVLMVVKLTSALEGRTSEEDNLNLSPTDCDVPESPSSAEADDGVQGPCESSKWKPVLISDA